MSWWNQIRRSVIIIIIIIIIGSRLKINLILDVVLD